MNWRRRYECSLFDKVLPIWNEKKEEGVVVIAPRQSGKTTTIIKLAIQEVTLGNTVTIWCINEEHKHYITRMIREQYVNIPDGLYFCNIHGIGMNPTPVTTFNFYDECNEITKEPNSLIIRSLQPRFNTYIFNVDNLKTNIDKKRLNEFKAQIPREQFLAEFKSGVM